MTKARWSICHCSREDSRHPRSRVLGRRSFCAERAHDIYLIAHRSGSQRFERTVERLRAYREAGADCLSRGSIRLETIQKLVQALKLPLNILAIRLPRHRANGKSRRGPCERRLRHHARRHGLVQRSARRCWSHVFCEMMFVGATPFID